ncbi:ATP-dependent Clp protease proteolytic subunit 1 [Roseovarius sp. A-2]|uniref:head maturation protease, ClpP-related n=1 Tax=Roseovarius sp. A-2 TaxID=1570360 RepID=UPI0009B5893F|nr:head maturation protease, ClpP-related [Roseovarius sp. A-2]GAW36997.1 ATP-dependent Clp protease proteolytic subunit 1 [Roseovarius sp. A-2]
MSEQIERPGNVVSLADYREMTGAASGPKAAGFEIKAAAEDGGETEVWLYGEVGWEIRADRVIAALKDIDSEDLTIRFRINSPGGDVFEGYALGNFIRGMNAHTIGQVDALAASMASFLAVVCDETVMHSNSMMMIHEPWTITLGSADDHTATATLLSKLAGQMIAEYDRKRADTLGELEEGAEDTGALVKAETWLTAQEAEALGLANSTLDAVEVAACVRADTLAAFRNAPEEISELVMVGEEEAPADPEDEKENAPEPDPVVEGLKSAADTAVSTARDDAPAEQAPRVRVSVFEQLNKRKV